MKFLIWCFASGTWPSVALRTATLDTSNETRNAHCKSCDLVNLDQTLSLTWSIFPPNPIPGYSISMYCSPERSVDWSKDPEVEAVMEEGCGFDQDAEELSASDDTNCRQQSASVKKRASYLGVPAAYLRQMVVCGRCAVCSAFAKVRNLWKKIKAAVQKVVAKLHSVKTSLFGHSYAPESVRSEMQRRFDGYFPKDTSVPSSGQSFLEKTPTDDEEEITPEKVEKALREHLADKPEKFVQNHISLLQRKLEEVEQHEEELMKHAMRHVMKQTQKSQQMLEQKLPAMINNEDCQEVLGTSATGVSMISTLTVSFPNMAGAILNAVLLNFAGALYALLPGVYLSATPRGFQRVGGMDRCLEAIRQDQMPFLDSCSHEQPLMTCTARTYQRIMQNALSEQWWPLMHNAEGTLGSINLGYKYDELMRSLQCSSKGSCMEKNLDQLGKDNLKEILENSSAQEVDRLNEMQCSFAANRVDSEDQTGKAGEYSLPVFTDKIWAVALKAHGALVLEPDLSRPCPEMLPWVVAFCASEYNCMDTSTDVGFFDSNDWQAAQKRAADTVAPLRKYVADAAGSGSLSESGEKAFDEQWEHLVRSKFDIEEDAFQWTLLWSLANTTNEAGLMPSWPQILEALVGKRTIDWKSARLHWEKVLFSALLRLRIREEHSHGPVNVQDERSLAQVVLNLQSIYETKLCSPGALGGLKDEHLHRLGVEEKESMMLAFHDLSKQDAVKGMWRNWLVLHVEVLPGKRRRFYKSLEESSCSCMCYEACGKLQPSAAANCQGLTDPLDGKERRRIKAMKVKRIVIDRMGEPAHKVLNSAVYLKVFRKQTVGGCSTELQVTDRYNPPVRGFISKCSVPEYFQQSEDLGLTITLWTDPRMDKPYEFTDFLELHRPWREWDELEDDDDDMEFPEGDDSDDWIEDYVQDIEDEKVA